MRKRISYIEVFIVIILIAVIIRVGSYKKSIPLAHNVERTNEVVKLLIQGKEILSTIAIKSDKSEKVVKCLHAIEFFDIALDINPKYKKAWFYKGVTLYILHKCNDNRLCITEEGIIRCLDKALEIDPDYYKVWRSKAIIFLEWEQYEEAINCFDQAIRVIPDSSEMWRKKGNCLKKLGEYEEAEKCYSVAEELSPSFGPPWVLPAR